MENKDIEKLTDVNKLRLFKQTIEKVVKAAGSYLDEQIDNLVTMTTESKTAKKVGIALCTFGMTSSILVGCGKNNTNNTVKNNNTTTEQVNDDVAEPTNPNFFKEQRIKNSEFMKNFKEDLDEYMNQDDWKSPYHEYSEGYISEKEQKAYALKKEEVKNLIDQLATEYPEASSDYIKAFAIAFNSEDLLVSDMLELGGVTTPEEFCVLIEEERVYYTNIFKLTSQMNSGGQSFLTSEQINTIRMDKIPGIDKFYVGNNEELNIAINKMAESHYNYCSVSLLVADPNITSTLYTKTMVDIMVMETEYIVIKDMVLNLLSPAGGVDLDIYFDTYGENGDGLAKLFDIPDGEPIELKGIIVDEFYKALEEENKIQKIN